MTDWWSDYWGFVLLATLCIGLLALGVAEVNQWAAFAKAHHCKVVSHEAGTTSFTAKGDAIFSPGKTGYLCDDGITYIR